MAEEPHVIRGINWRETFPFTNIFRAFRIAVHPSKLALGLVALLLIYFGGRALDFCWLAAPSHRVVAVPMERDGRVVVSGAPEIESYRLSIAENDKSFSEWRKTTRDRNIAGYAALLQQYKIVDNADKAKEEAAAGRRLGELKKKLIDERDQKVKDAAKARDDALGKAKEEEKDGIKKKYVADAQAAFKTATDTYTAASSMQGAGPFITFFNFEAAQINGVARGVLENRWLEAGGVKDCILNFLVWAPVWAFGAHWLYAILFGIWLLAIWSAFGGAIARIAAVHVARDEKVSFRAALGFSVNKFLSFLSAPLIPLVIVFVAGAVVAFFGWWMIYLPPLLGILLVLALLAGFVMTLLVVGTAGGLNLMYPTVAVEGSDSFDAISRSFSYVYARPWRMLWYTLVALTYGALTYLFVRLVVFLSLSLTHFCVGMWSSHTTAGEQNMWSVLWPAPSFWSMPYEIDFMSMGAMQSINAVFVAFWVYMIIALMGAFVISFYFSANTIIYYLMRKEVDATEMDDVYVEQAEEEVTEPTAAPAAPTEPAAVGTGAMTAPAAPVVETPAPPAEPTPPAPAEPPANPPTP